MLTGKSSSTPGSALLEPAFELALRAGVVKLVAQMASEQSAAPRLFAALGFEPEAVLRGHVMDAAGERRLAADAFDTARQVMPACDGYGAGG